MSINSAHEPMQDEKTLDVRDSGGTMRTMVVGMLLKPIDMLINFLWYIDIKIYKGIFGRLPKSWIFADNDRLGELQDENARIKEQIKSLQSVQHCTQLEKEDALRRLSEIISVKLRDNNPNIVDLNDQCRPTKLGEMFSELYDNEWTNAYSVIAHKFTEEQSIVILLDIVMEAYEYCSRVVNGSWENLEQWFINKDMKQSSEQQKVMKWLKDNRKAMVSQKLPEQSKNFKEMILTMCGDEVIKPLLNDEDVNKYIDKCIELCLLMTANDPPVIIICPDWKSCCQLTSEPESNKKNEGESQEIDEKIMGTDRAAISPLERFAKDLYKEYTQRGQYLKYIVWPVLLLHEGGSTLAKGVAQGTNDIDCFEKFTWRVRIVMEPGINVPFQNMFRRL